ncbi:transmembrane amino acid transporter protein-domain-containing protein [Pisolithus marmoratus]|nr:transmembrane amino acid transporter protein-domain-containing protein [Pisolithus marmoratus]
MVREYGTIKSINPEHDLADDQEVRSTEDSVLLGSGSATVLMDGPATMFSSICNLANTILGSGMLTFPLAMASGGVIPGVITCVFSGVVGGFGLYLLTQCARRTPHRRSSFFAVAQLTFPQAAVFFDAAIAIKCFGVSIGYLIIIKSLMPSVVASLYHDLTSPSTNPPQWALSGPIWLVVFMIILVPLASLRRLDSLRHTSYIALFSAAYLVVIVIRCYFKPLEDTVPRGDIHLIHFTPTFVTTFPVQVFAFTCAQNIFPIFNELKTNSNRRVNIVVGTSVGGAILIYEIIAIFGYLTFGSNVGANIIAMYPSTSVFIAVGQLAIVVLILFSYPLQVQPCRACLDKIFHRKQVYKPVGGADEDEEGVLEDDEVGADMSALKHAVLTAAIVACGFAIAYYVDDLQMVLSFVGSTGSTTISFILPGLFFWKLTKDDPTVSRVLNRSAIALVAYGGCVFVFCLGFNVYQVIHPSRGGVGH